ncbi:MAG: hypothetical protein ACYDH9_10125 [Limisphaerales bacterium]
MIELQPDCRATQQQRLNKQQIVENAIHGGTISRFCDRRQFILRHFFGSGASSVSCKPRQACAKPEGFHRE